MKKLLALAMIFAVLLTVMMSCEIDTSDEVTECVHEFSDPTCEAPKTCKKCGETEGEVAAHTIEDGKCPTCGKGIFDVMVLWDEEPGQSSNSEPVYDYYDKDSDTMKFYPGSAYELDEVPSATGGMTTGTTVSAVLKIDKAGIEAKAYDWQVLVQEYVYESHSYRLYRISGSIRAAEFSKDTVLQCDEYDERLTEEQVSEYLTNYGASLIERIVTGDLKTFLRENGEDVELLGFDNYAN